MSDAEMIIKLISGGGVAALAGIAWNLRNAWKASLDEAKANERRHQEALSEFRQAHAVQNAILAALTERMDRADVRADRIETRIEALLASRKD